MCGCSGLLVCIDRRRTRGSWLRHCTMLRSRLGACSGFVYWNRCTGGRGYPRGRGTRWLLESGDRLLLSMRTQRYSLRRRPSLTCGSPTPTPLDSRRRHLRTVSTQTPRAAAMVSPGAGITHNRRVRHTYRHGSITSIPVSRKSLRLRVAKAASWVRQMDAICASNPSIDRPARSRRVTITG